MPVANSVRHSVMHVAVSASAGVAAFILLQLAGLQNRVALYAVALTTTTVLSAYFQARRTGQPVARLLPRAVIAGLVAGIAVGLFAIVVGPYVQR